MKRDALVVSVRGKLMAEITRTEACGDCRACQMGQKAIMHYPLPKGDYKPGDIVSLEINDNVLSRATVIAYGIPLSALLIGLCAGFMAFEAEWAQALTALISLTAAGLYIFFTEKKRREKGSFTCRASKNIDQ